MAKAASLKIKLVSSADTGHYYVTKKNSRTQTEKLTKKKYDPIAQEARRVSRSQDQVSRRARSLTIEKGARGRPLYFVMSCEQRWPAGSGD